MYRTLAVAGQLWCTVGLLNDNDDDDDEMSATSFKILASAHVHRQ